jgi:hypothetical protein
VVFLPLVSGKYEWRVLVRYLATALDPMLDMPILNT